MKERPIIYSTEMIKAILNDRKTQTRRVALMRHLYLRIWTQATHWEMSEWSKAPLKELPLGYPIEDVLDCCPYGIPGDRLWVKETFQVATLVGDDADEWWEVEHERLPKEKPNLDYWRIHYKADGRNEVETWRPSIFMPRWASRISLEIVNVRVERVQEISEIDCEIELGQAPYSLGDNAYVMFKELWNSINAKRGFGWDVNPWVWVIEFKRVA